MNVAKEQFERKNMNYVLRLCGVKINCWWVLVYVVYVRMTPFLL